MESKVYILILETIALVNRHLRYIIFTMEVAVAAMPPGVDQWILILDAGGRVHESQRYSSVLRVDDI